VKNLAKIIESKDVGRYRPFPHEQPEPTDFGALPGSRTTGWASKREPPRFLPKRKQFAAAAPVRLNTHGGAAASNANNDNGGGEREFQECL
jgi:hypothetical protein